MALHLAPLPHVASASTPPPLGHGAELIGFLSSLLLRMALPRLSLIAAVASSLSPSSPHWPCHFLSVWLCLHIYLCLYIRLCCCLCLCLCLCLFSSYPLTLPLPLPQPLLPPLPASRTGAPPPIRPNSAPRTPRRVRRPIDISVSNQPHKTNNFVLPIFESQFSC